MEGIWRQRVIATRRGEREPELVMTMAPLGWAGRGTVTLRGGQTYQWGPRSLLHDRVWQLTDQRGRPLLTCHQPWLQQARDTDRLMSTLKAELPFPDVLWFLPVYTGG